METDSTPKHTPAPWTQGHGEARHNAQFVYAKSTAICQVLGIWQNHTLEELEQDERKDHIAEGMANARLIAAAPNLLEAQTMGNGINTPDFLDWIAERLVNIHHYRPNIDFILSLRERASAGRAAIALATNPQPENTNQ